MSSHYPHSCPVCGSPAYVSPVGMLIDCSKAGCKNSRVSARTTVVEDVNEAAGSVTLSRGVGRAPAFCQIRTAHYSAGGSVVDWPCELVLPTAGSLCEVCAYCGHKRSIQSAIVFNHNLLSLVNTLRGNGMPPGTWTLDMGKDFVREIERISSLHGAHAALAGSVLMKGTSTKDLDVIVYPHADDITQSQRNSIVAEFAAAGMLARPFGVPGLGYTKKDVTIFDVGGWRVDIFWLQA